MYNNLRKLLVAAAFTFTALAAAPRTALAGDARPAGSSWAEMPGGDAGKNAEVHLLALAILVPVLVTGGAVVGRVVWRRRIERRPGRVPAVTPSATPPLRDNTPVYSYTRRPRSHSARYVVR